MCNMCTNSIIFLCFGRSLYFYERSFQAEAKIVLNLFECWFYLKETSAVISYSLCGSV
jgi:hypothetical protein